MDMLLGEDMNICDRPDNQIRQASTTPAPAEINTCTHSIKDRLQVLSVETHSTRFNCDDKALSLRRSPGSVTKATCLSSKNLTIQLRMLQRESLPVFSLKTIRDLGCAELLCRGLKGTVTLTPTTAVTLAFQVFEIMFWNQPSGRLVHCLGPSGIATKDHDSLGAWRNSPLSFS